MMPRWIIACLMMTMGAAAAQEPPIQASAWRINNIPLDMPLEAEFNGEFLEGIYQEKLADRLIGSVLNEWPSYHIATTLKIGKLTAQDAQEGAELDPVHERMEIYFSSRADGRRAFWIRSRKPMDAPADAAGTAETLAMIEANFGKPTRIVTRRERPGDAIVIVADPAAKARLPDPLVLSDADYLDFWSMDLQDRARILGPDFRGAIVLLIAFQGRLQAMQTELIDLGRAQTVFELTP
ncbi:hypothetical protein [Dongia sp.]|uniref:hypothetical protein n=1 Tax=Dongia sp. TaxID=1977262 RepID=UPI0035AE3A30